VIRDMDRKTQTSVAEREMLSTVTTMLGAG
jgi:hypothetical protein